MHVHGGQDQRVLMEQALRYTQALQGHANYTHYVGGSDDSTLQWIRNAGHRNIPIHAFAAENHIADYWDDAANPHHCCVNPEEYGDSTFQGFFARVGGGRPVRICLLPM